MRILILSIFLSISFSQFSPGDLAIPHAYIEGNKFCQDCHSKGKVVDNDDCLSCHSIIKSKIDNSRGYHGNLEDNSCSLCHSDHNGLEFKMIYWKNGKDNFDHNKTSYDLVDKHQNIDCEKCHNEKFIKSEDVVNWEIDSRQSNFLNRTYLGLVNECSSCHDDVHESKLSSKCVDCHDVKGWETASRQFNHDKTEYPLTEKHLEVDCVKCHFKQQKPEKIDLTFQNYYGKKCVDCHTDVHQNQFTDNCSQCHTTKSWKLPLPYNHEVSFSSTLIESHVNVSCLQCHFSGENHDVINPGITLTAENRCLACHEDKHKNEFGAKCNDCHNYTNWKEVNSFDHNSTKFKLQGKHENTECLKCHKPEKTKSLEFDFCGRCHEDRHANQFNKYENTLDCGACHNENNWTPSYYSIETHQTSNFKLEGAHLAVPCFKCHQPSSEYDNTVQYIFQDLKCQTCHTDIHYSQFEEKVNNSDCTSCHSVEQWKIINFDHSNTTFPLDGEHLKVECKKCHFPEMIFVNNSFESFVRYKPINHGCSDCHSFEDFK